MQRKISIITATFNSEKLLNRCLNSVSQQSFSNIEHIIVDGASNDDTMSMVVEYQNRCRYVVKVISEPDRGIYDAFNKGLKIASGEYITFLNSDDYFYSEDFLKKIITLAEGDFFDIISSDLIIINPKTNLTYRKWCRSIFWSILPKALVVPPHPGLFIHKSLYKKIGVFDTRYNISADYDYIIRAFSESRKEIGYLNDTGVIMTSGGASSDGLNSFHKKLLQDYLILRQYCRYPLMYTVFKRLLKLSQYLNLPKIEPRR